MKLIKETWTFVKPFINGPRDDPMPLNENRTILLLSKDKTRGSFTLYKEYKADRNNCCYDCYGFEMYLKLSSNGKILEFDIYDSVTQSERDFVRRENPNGITLKGFIKNVQKSKAREIFTPFWEKYIKNKTWKEVLENPLNNH